MRLLVTITGSGAKPARDRAEGGSAAGLASLREHLDLARALVDANQSHLATVARADRADAELHAAAERAIVEGLFHRGSRQTCGDRAGIQHEAPDVFERGRDLERLR